MRAYDLQNMSPLDWEDMRQKVSEIEIQKIESFNFLLDFGTCFELLGFDLITNQIFMDIGYHVGSNSLIAASYGRSLWTLDLAQD